MSPREQILLIAAIFMLLLVFSASNFRERLDLISSKRDSVASLKVNLNLQKELINSAKLWAERYDAVKEQMPVFAPDKQVATYWLNIMDLAAERYGFKIKNRRAGTETLLSDVYEFPIEVRDWEGTLESFLKFMYAMQSEGAMLSVRDVTVTTVPNRQGILKGTFTLYCAYMRGAAAEAENASVPASDNTNGKPSPGIETANPSGGAETAGAVNQTNG